MNEKAKERIAETMESHVEKLDLFTCDLTRNSSRGWEKDQHITLHEKKKERLSLEVSYTS